MIYTGQTKAAAAVSLLDNERRLGSDISRASEILINDYKRLLLENERLKQEVKQARAELFKANETILLFEEPIDFSRFYEVV